MTDWREEQRRAYDNRPALPVIDWAKVREQCPLCALDLKRIPAIHEDLYGAFHIYTCAMWTDVYHIANTNGCATAHNSLVREKHVNRNHAPAKRDAAAYRRLYGPDD